MQREDRNEGDIGKHDARHRHRLGELVGLADKARRSQPHEQRHVEVDDAEQDDLRDDQEREHLTRELGRFLGAGRFQNAGIGRQVGGVERALAEDLAELVGKLDRRHIGVVERAPAHERGDCDVAQEASQPGGDRPAADQEDVEVHWGRFN